MVIKFVNYSNSQIDLRKYMYFQDEVKYFFKNKGVFTDSQKSSQNQ